MPPAVNDMAATPVTPTPSDEVELRMALAKSKEQIEELTRTNQKLEREVASLQNSV